MSEENKNQSRRDFLKIGAAAGLGAAVAGLGLEARPSGLPGEARSQFRAPAVPTVKVGFVGVGGMGSGHVQNYLNIEGVQIKAICDIGPAHVERAQKWVVEAGQPKPAGYSNGPRDFERMCATEDLDLVMTATPWEWHVPVCLAAMKNGKHAATEVPAAMTLDDCWELVETAEKHRKHCQMMENCCYDRIELMILNIVRKGVLGEILHAEAGYLHDLRGVKFSSEGEGLWRRAWSQKLNGNLYPTHGWARRPVHEHQPRRRVRLPRVDELPDARPPRIRRGDVRRGLAAGQRTLCPRRRQHEPDQDEARQDDHPHPRHEPAAAVQPDRPRPGHAKGWPTSVPTGSTSKARPRSHMNGTISRSSPPNTSIRCGRPSPRRARAGATAAWTISRTTA